MASSSSSKKLKEHCLATINVQCISYPSVKLYVFPDLCADINLGKNWQAKHTSVMIEYEESKSSLKICNLPTLNVAPPLLLKHLTPQCKPTAASLRKYCQQDRIFIASEINALRGHHRTKRFALEGSGCSNEKCETQKETCNRLFTNHKLFYNPKCVPTFEDRQDCELNSSILSLQHYIDLNRSATSGQR